MRSRLKFDFTHVAMHQYIYLTLRLVNATLGLRWWGSFSAEVKESINFVTVRTRVTPNFRVLV